MARGNSWTSDEIQTLRDHYSTMSTSELMGLLPKRSQKAIIKKAFALKLKKSKEFYVSNNIAFLLEGSKESYYWYGYILGDGSVDYKRYSVRIKSLDIDHLQQFADLCQKHVVLSKNDYGNLQGVVTACDKLHFGDIVGRLDILADKTCHPPRIAVFERLSDNEFMYLFFGLVDSDGSIRFRDNKNTCSITIVLHHTWLDVLKYLSTRIAKIFNEPTPLPSPISDCNGFANMCITRFSLVKKIKKFGIDHGVSLMKRKWDRIDLTHTGGRERSLSLRASIKELYNNGLHINAICEKLGAVRNSIKYHVNCLIRDRQIVRSEDCPTVSPWLRRYQST